MRKIFLFISLAAIISSCRKEIDIKLDSTYTRIVVDGLITNEAKRHTIKISKTSNYFDNSAQPIAIGAVVTINDGSTAVTLTETSAGIYQTDSNYIGVIGKIYTLNVKYDNEEYEAVCKLKQVAEMDSVTVTKNIFPFDTNYYSINMFALEPATTGDYYVWKYYVNGKLFPDTINLTLFESDEMVNGNYIYNLPVYSDVSVKAGDSVALEISSINKEYYDFMYSIMFESHGGGGNPFSGPPSNVVGNVKNITNPNKDVMGFFIASAVSKKSTVVK